MFKEIHFPEGFFSNNRKKLTEKLEEKTVIFILSSLDMIKNRDTHYRFRQDSNYFYLTGLELKRSVLAVYKYNGKVYETLFRKVLDPTLEKWVGRNVSVEDIKRTSGISDIRDINDLDDYLSNVFSGIGIEKVLMYNETSTDLLVPTYTQVFASKLRMRFAFITIKAVNPILDEIRKIKSECEIAMIKRAIEITTKGLEDLIHSLYPGISENECEGILIKNYIKYGSVQPAFQTIAASGANATVLHYEDNDQVTGKNDLILIDTGSEYKNYASDITRTYPVSGKFTSDQKKFYNIVLKASKEVMKKAKPGVTLAQLQDVTKEVLFKGLFDMKMVKEKSDLTKYYYHGVSHFLGLDTHDVGSYQTPLEKNCVITVEPGLYIAEKKIGIRLENDVLITDKGCRNLSESIPIEADEIEDIMNRKKR
ncbi:MAG TPA: aminopeptidase P N-terminal domain-containing protein [Clostridiales bacterium]|nr:aminopeptidase P N-terminal domain-containing protein [Clostridiales bacterium]HQP69255.1 aminopeptidase P N-terminal domain-containing protein [Clostridiales bacterium]